MSTRNQPRVPTLRSVRTGPVIPLVLSVLAVAAGSSPTEAQEGAAGGSGSGVADAAVVRTTAVRADVDVEVDGRIDESTWAAVAPISNFVQGEPTEGVPAEYDTEVRIIFGEDAIYVAARMWDDPETVARQLVRRDDRGNFDWFAVSLDTNMDRRTGYSFQVSAANVQRDEYLFDDSRQDGAWDAVWESGVQVDADGWTAELKIPYSQIRYSSSSDPQTWGVNFIRRRQANNELSYWALRSRLQQGVVSQFGELDDVLVTQGARRIEARPYVLSSLHQGPAAPDDPFFDGRESQLRLGTDLRVGLGSAFSLDATINPDFGQVEADPAVINLSAFETFFEERRPFFVEDANLLRFGLSGGRNDLFYSRRIGRSPQGRAPSGTLYRDEPSAATILGAAKITGRTDGGLSVGGLAAVTQEETGWAYLGDEEGNARYVAEPQSRFGVLRLQQDFNDGASTVGGIFTAMNRGLPSDGSFDFLPSSAFTAGLQFEHQWSDRTWALEGFLAGSLVQGDSTALTRIQRSSNHYNQRPDATRLSVDSTATSMSGLEWRLQFEKRRGDHWTWAVWAAQLTDGFEINDLGYSQNRERLDGGFRVSYREIEPGSVFQNYNVSFFTFHNWSHEALDAPGSWESWNRARTSGSFNLNSRGEFLNNWGANMDLSLNPDTYSRTATRGGPVMLDPGSWRVSTRMNTDRRKAVNFSANVQYRSGFQESGDEFSIGGGIEMRPTANTEIAVQPRWSSENNAAQYVTTSDALFFGPTYGNRYLFAELERKSLSMETRLNVSFSPALTFQLFAQPLLSSGDYVRYRQLAEAGTYDFLEFQEGDVSGDGMGCVGGTICRDDTDEQYVDFDGDGVADESFGDRDFNVRSLVGNAVLRWEYRPGSTVFLVWQRQQRGSVAVGDFDFGRDWGGLWDAPAENVFIVKMNYWLDF
ncbi:MAG TPA: DUF5916 domain-containing protein [Longimicrobiales bacterium]|nr:DUF5916 domain-containing protein [Longimicrobiales bacterium]